jgi:hypothetical protein
MDDVVGGTGEVVPSALRASASYLGWPSSRSGECLAQIDLAPLDVLRRVSHGERRPVADIGVATTIR